MKPKTIIHGVDGTAIRIVEPIEDVAYALAQNSPFPATRVTDNGHLHRCVVRTAFVHWVEDAESTSADGWPQLAGMMRYMATTADEPEHLSAAHRRALQVRGAFPFVTR